MADKSKLVAALAMLLRELRDAHAVAEETGYVDLLTETWMAEYAVRNCQRLLAALTAAGQREELFPIQQGHPGVPWPAALMAYKTYSRQFGTQQSLEELGKRGGFGLYEFACLYLDVPMRNDMMERHICQALGRVAQAAKEDDAPRTELLDEATSSLSMLEQHIRRAYKLLGEDSQRKYAVLSMADWANARSRLSSALGEVDALRVALVAVSDASRTELLDEVLSVMEEARDYLGVFSDGPAHTIWLKLDSLIERAHASTEET